MSRLPLKSLNTALILGLMIAAPAQAGSLYFDGNNDSIVVSDFIELGGPITLEAWVRVETATNAGRLISNRNFGGYDFSIWDPDGNSNLELNLSLNGGLEILAPLPRSILGTWIHVAWTWEGPVDGTMKLFLNGSEIASSVRNTTVDPTQGTFRIGSMGWSASAFNFHGAID